MQTVFPPSLSPLHHQKTGQINFVSPLRWFATRSFHHLGSPRWFDWGSILTCWLGRMCCQSNENGSHSLQGKLYIGITPTGKHSALTGRPLSHGTIPGLSWKKYPSHPPSYLPAGVLLPLLMPLTGEDIPAGPDVPLDAFLPPDPGCCCCFSISKHKAYGIKCKLT